MSINDQSKLMSAMGLSDSFDSSSDDIIPMQKRKRQRSYSKRRNIRGAPTSSSVLFKSNYTYGLCTLVKFILLTFVIGALLLSLALLYNLYNRLELLQVNIDGLQSTKSNLPEEMHLIHSQLKKLDQNSTQLRNELSIALDLASNMTNDIAQIQAKLQKVSESIEAAPAIAQLPKDVDDLKKIVADLGSKMSSDDKEVKLAREGQASHDARLVTLESNIKLIEGNMSAVDNLTVANTQLSETVTKVQSDITRITANLSDFNALISQVNQSQQRLDEWRLLIQDRIASLNDTSSTASAAAPLVETNAGSGGGAPSVSLHKKDDPTQDELKSATVQASSSDSSSSSNM
ncbi:Efcab14p [Tyrophagus putrescentiae]|nr:Efcab14p [Tyrophagus putrescentiae]